VTTPSIGHEALRTYLTRVLGGPVEILALRPLGDQDASLGDPKAFGYGVCQAAAASATRK
jgi:hypothetical protein